MQLAYLHRIITLTIARACGDEQIPAAPLFTGSCQTFSKPCVALVIHDTGEAASWREVSYCAATLIGRSISDFPVCSPMRRNTTHSSWQHYLWHTVALVTTAVWT